MRDVLERDGAVRERDGWGLCLCLCSCSEGRSNRLCACVARLNDPRGNPADIDVLYAPIIPPAPPPPPPPPPPLPPTCLLLSLHCLGGFFASSAAPRLCGCRVTSPTLRSSRATAPKAGRRRKQRQSPRWLLREHGDDGRQPLGASPPSQPCNEQACRGRVVRQMDMGVSSGRAAGGQRVGSGRACIGRALGAGKAELSRAELSRAEQSRAEQSRAGTGEIGPVHVVSRCCVIDRDVSKRKDGDLMRTTWHGGFKSTTYNACTYTCRGYGYRGAPSL